MKLMKNNNSSFSRTISCILVTIALAASSAVANAASWQLSKDESKITFVSIKKDVIGEVHTFNDFSGDITEGKASVTILADSVDTGVGIRNDRVREFLFKTGTFPTISINSDVAAALKGVEKGKTIEAEVPATLSLHGVSKEVTLSVSLTRNGKSSVVVASNKPVIVKAKDYNLDAGILKLSELVGNIDITDAVPVSFVLTFKKA